MALVNLFGAESGNAAQQGPEHLASIGSGVTHDATVKRTGSYSMKVNPTTTNAGAVTFGNCSNGVHVGINAANVFARVYFRVDTLPAAANEEIFAFRTSGSVYKLSGRITSAGKLQIYDTSIAQIGSDGATTLATDGTWYRLDLKCGTGATAAYEVKINGVVEFSGTANLNTTNNDHLALGKVTNRNGNTVLYHYDDLAIDNAAYPAVGRIGILVANGDGNYSGWNLNGAPTKWEALNEIPSSTGDEVYSNVLNDVYTATYGNTAGAGISGTINAIKFCSWAQRQNAGAGYVGRIRSGGVDSDSGAMPDALVLNTGGYILATDPATGLAWSLTALDAIEAGMRCTANGLGTSVKGQYILVDYDDSAPVGGAVKIAYVKKPKLFAE